MNVFFLLTATFILCTGASYQALSKKPIPSLPHFAIVFDAGSSGTRIYVLEFVCISSPPKNAEMCKFVNQTYVEGDQALTDFKNDPESVGSLINPLIKAAQRIIPKSLWHQTPLNIMATAGFRMLNKSEANLLIEHLSDLLWLTPFHTYDGSVSIIDGEDEGLFGWFTVNYMLQRLETPSKSKMRSSTVGTIFIGGGSMQVAFLPRSSATYRRAPSRFLKEYRIFGRSYKMYSASYLGNGLIESRLGSLRRFNKKWKNSKILKTGCMPNRTSFNWTHKGSAHEIRGEKNFGFDVCMKEQQLFLKFSNLHKPVELKWAELFLSGQASVLVNNAVGFGKNGGNVTMKLLRSQASKSCSGINPIQTGKSVQWTCRDLCYVLAVLKKFGLGGNKSIFVSDKIRNMKVRWALGAGYNLLDSVS